MRRSDLLARTMLLAGVAFLFGVGGCVDDKVVFKERPLFDQPPDAAGNFAGYRDASQKQTICGACHVGKQGAWERTAHADAWAGLQESGGAQEFCEGCHTVGQEGNMAEEAVGWETTRDPRYHDVQCESCHGGALDHVENPDQRQPLANLAVAAGLETGCGECHTGTHHPFVEQWELSRHGQVPAQGTAASVGSFCLPCHEGKSALANKMGETSNFVEQGGDLLPITCGVCHDPHPEGTAFTAQLRAPITVASEDHLCVRCHSREGTPNTTGSNVHGPHAFQGLLVLGTDVGWIPPGSDLSDAGRIISTHGSERNPELCATCHLSSFEVTDQETGEFAFQSVGHTFEAIPCLDQDGIPTGESDCVLSARTFEACAETNCHGSADAARGIFVTVRSRIDDLLDALWDDADGDQVLETADGGLLPQVLAQQGPDEINVFDSRFTTAEGALWNAQISFTDENPHWGDGRVEGQTDHFGSHKGSGEGVHNPFLIEALLRASAEAVRDEYNLGSLEVDLGAQLTPPPGVR